MADASANGAGDNIAFTDASPRCRFHARAAAMQHKLPSSFGVLPRGALLWRSAHSCRASDCSFQSFWLELSTAQLLGFGIDLMQVGTARWRVVARSGGRNARE
jgi:hypothetical protein